MYVSYSATYYSTDSNFAAGNCLLVFISHEKRSGSASTSMSRSFCSGLCASQLRKTIAWSYSIYECCAKYCIVLNKMREYKSSFLNYFLKIIKIKQYNWCSRGYKRTRQSLSAHKQGH